MWARIDRNRCVLLLNTLPFDHKSGSPESLFGLLPDINKPPVLLRLPVGEDEMNIAIR